VIVARSIRNVAAHNYFSLLLPPNLNSVLGGSVISHQHFDLPSPPHP
jgi:hypothetical protein